MHADDAGQVDRVAHDVGLGIEVGGDVDRRVGDDERAWIAWGLHQIAVGESPRRAQAELAVQRRADELVGVQAALHQRIDLAGPGQFDRACRSCVAVPDILDLDVVEIEPGGLGDRLEPHPRPDQHRHDQVCIARLERRRQRCLVAGMDHRATHGRQVVHRIEQAAHAIAITQAHVGQGRAPAHDLFFGSDHAGLAGDHFAAVLVDAAAGQGELAGGLVARGHFDRDLQGVADPDRGEEAQGLAEIDRAGPGQAGAEQGRDQRTTPHAVGNDAMESRRRGEFGIDMLRIVVAGNDREQLHVAGGQATFDAGAIADRDLGEGAVAHVAQVILGKAVFDRHGGLRLVGHGARISMGPILASMQSGVQRAEAEPMAPGDSLRTDPLGLNGTTAPAARRAGVRGASRRRRSIR